MRTTVRVVNYIRRQAVEVYDTDKIEKVQAKNKTVGVTGVKEKVSIFLVKEICIEDIDVFGQGQRVVEKIDNMRMGEGVQADSVKGISREGEKHIFLFTSQAK